MACLAAGAGSRVAGAVRRSGAVACERRWGRAGCLPWAAAPQAGQIVRRTGRGPDSQAGGTWGPRGRKVRKTPEEQVVLEALSRLAAVVGDDGDHRRSTAAGSPRP